MKQHITIFALIAAALALIGGIIWINRSPFSGTQTPAQSEWSGGAIAAKEPFYDFGTISMASGKVSYPFSVKNESNEPVTISKISTSCMCTAATFKKGTVSRGPFGMPGHAAIPKINEILAPGEEAQIIAVFDPAAHGPSGTGKARRIVYLETNSQTKPKLELSFEANVIP